MKKIILNSLIVTLMGLTQQTMAMTALDDEALSAVDAQALLNMEKNYDSGQKINFFKLSVEALMELNANIKTLQLGCGGSNGAGACDIDISNISLSGLHTGKITDINNPDYGSPTFSSDRAGTSAEITNPFIEFAIKGDSAATREVIGFRLGAEKIIGLLTLGTDNTLNPGDGIQSFSGYMKMAQTNGESITKTSKFGMAQDEKISGNLKALGQERTFTSKPGEEGHTGITVPSMRVNFSMPETIVTGNRMKSATVTGIRSSIASIPLAAAETGKTLPNTVQGTPDFSKDKLYVEFPALISLGGIINVGDHSFFKMKAGSSLDNLNLDITFVQALSMIHNIPLEGTGGYLSLQNQAVKWLGSDVEDIAQPGWWMSFEQPIQLGYLKTQGEVDISNVLPQVATAISDFLLHPDNLIDVNVLEAIGSLAKVPVEKKLNIDVGRYTNYTNGTPAALTLTNQILQNQKVTSNCFGGHKFC
ncbi:hypothetical protein [Acinetobacter variabilis]|uniref:Uncharacterized protein n=1 Tax=Acinetobacter variabilis TaxID=70346 RepID=N8WSA7_9GAMM|nr:hypothetical protein [Acinetobacter variabilis]ENU98142.1 hypothetical protein F969_02869 [Acinetobacter variabilis]